MKKCSMIAVRYWKPISIFVIIIVLCLIPASEFDKLKVKISFADLIVHFFMFFTFAAVLFFDLDKYTTGQNIKYSPLVISIIISVLFGITIEILQYLLTFLNRTGSFVDLLFDFIGSCAGIVLVRFTWRKSDAVF
jgi:VanZ family protein